MFESGPVNKPNQRGLYVMKADDPDDITRLTDGSWNTFAPDWSPNGERIVFESGPVDQPNQRELYTMKVDDPDNRDIIRLTDNSWGDFAPDWSPDGEHIAFASQPRWAVGHLQDESRRS